MKVWKGPELEGTSKGIWTMFVSGSTINCQKVIELLKKNSECQRVYLGGGRIDVEEIENFDELYQYCTRTKSYIIVETSLTGLSTLPECLQDHADKLIVRLDDKLIDKLSGTDQFKLDSGSFVWVTPIENMIKTSLETLKKDMFNVDVLLYNESEEN